MAGAAAIAAALSLVRSTFSTEFLGKSDEKPFRSSNIAKPICFLVLNYFTCELRAAFAESYKGLVDVIDREHDAEIA